MNSYSTGMRDALALAGRVCLLKQNHFLDGVQAIQVDDAAYIPKIRHWWQMGGLRLLEREETTARLLRQVCTQWLAAARQTGAPAVFLLRKEHENLTILYGSGAVDLPALFQAQVPGCSFATPAEIGPKDSRYSGLLLGSMRAGGLADTLACSGLESAWVACIVLPSSDTEAQNLLRQDQALVEQLKPYRSFQRVSGNATRRTVDVPVPQVDRALALLKEEIQFLQHSGGVVRTAVRFGASDAASCWRLAEMIQSSLSGPEEKYTLEPVRCFLLEGGSSRNFLAVPRVPAGDGTGLRLPALSLQSLEQAGAFCTPPVHSCPGFYVAGLTVGEQSRDLFPVLPPIQEDGATVGRTIEDGAPAVLPDGNLLSHMAVCGSSNTGKTNLVMQLLTRVWSEQQIPFVVLEAAKKEYCGLLGSIPELQVYTPGADGLLLQINPLRPENGTLIENQAAAVSRAVAAATGAEHPIPEAIEGLLKQSYRRFGWEYGMLAYTDPDRPFPTVRDLMSGVEDYIAANAQYGPEVRQNLTAALKLRCSWLAEGALGRMFASPVGLSARDLISAPTIIELADLSEESAAFLMNILLYRFQSYLQGLPASSCLQRLLVVEEAHNVFRRTLSEDSSLAKSNLAFEKLFAEVRSSGTGIVMSDQRPGVLPDAVMANTSIKACFGLSSESDRQVIGNAMGLSELQQKELNAFGIGECLVSVRGHRGVYHVKTDKMVSSMGYSPACLLCRCRFRCRKAAVEPLVRGLDQDLVAYHLSKIMKAGYGSSLRVCVCQMLKDLEVPDKPAEAFCLLGRVLDQAGVPAGESRRILRACQNNGIEKGVRRDA